MSWHFSSLITKIHIINFFWLLYTGWTKNLSNNYENYLNGNKISMHSHKCISRAHINDIDIAMSSNSMRPFVVQSCKLCNKIIFGFETNNNNIQYCEKKTTGVMAELALHLHFSIISFLNCIRNQGQA